MSGYDSGIDIPKPAAPTAGPTSIFQLCNNIYKRLGLIDDAVPFLQSSKEQLEQDENYNPIMGIDPVSLLWKAFRLGSPLSIMYNVLDEEDPVSVTPLEEADAKKAKASVYHFLLKCKNNLGMEEVELFSITDLFKDDTNAFIKVLKTASLLLDKMEAKNLIDTRELDLDGAKSTGPTDNRAKVVIEMLQTERKYIQDLEKLQNYMEEVQASKVISPDTIRYLFANLFQLVDFQRRFLIGVECNALLPPEEQRFGGLFVTFEDAFCVYEPFCANYGNASDLAAKEAPQLQALASIMEPNYELPSYLIKPIQRICKYPLLLRELIRYTKEEEYPHFDELKLGMKAIERVAGKVNEMRRKEENANVCEDLKTRVVNWDQLSVDDFGELLQNEKFIVVGKDQKEREMFIFLFSDVLICCKELSATSKRAKAVPKKASGPPLELRGRIPVKSLVKVADKNTEGEFFLRVYWKSDEMQILILKCRNEEQVKLWKGPIENLITKNKDPVAKKEFKGSDDSKSKGGDGGSLTATPHTMQNEGSHGSVRNRGTSVPPMPGVPYGPPYAYPNGNGFTYNLDRSVVALNYSTSQTKLKINFNQETFATMIPNKLEFSDLVDTIEKKMKSVTSRGQSFDLPVKYRIRYKDSENDYITITTDEDIHIALDSVRGTTYDNQNVALNPINIYID